MTSMFPHQPPSSANTIQDIKTWFDTAVPIPTDRSAHTQIAVHIEEFAEFLQTLQGTSRTFRMREQVGLAIDVLHFLERQIKADQDGDDFVLEDLDRVACLDALMDQIVTSVGVAHMLHMDPVGGLSEVSASNNSKFDHDGRPVFDQVRKIMKGPRYKAPDLTSHV